jgi:protein O-mannosyl-transferase
MRHSWNIRIGVVLLSLAALAAWSNSFHGAFVLDDIPTIVANPSIRRLGALGAVLSPPKMGSPVTGRPLVNLTLALNYAVSGTRVWSYHALNLLIHVLAGLTLFGIVRRTLARRVGAQSCGAPLEGRTGGAGFMPATEVGARRAGINPALQSDATLLAFAVALLWTLHPLQTEAVTYVVQRAESLMGLFYLLTLYCFIRGTESETPGGRSLLAGDPPRALSDIACPQAPTSVSRQSTHPWRWYSLSLLACLLGMATKEVMVSAPLIVLLYDRTFLAGSFRAAWRQRRQVYLGLAGTWLLLAWLVASADNRGGTAGFGTAVSAWDYALVQSGAIVHYLRLAGWPHPLVFDYGTAVVHSLAEVWWQTIVVLASLGLTIWALIRKPRCGFLGAWFFLILAPSSSVVPVVTQTMAEHRMYLPLAAVITLAVLGWYLLLQRLQDHRLPDSRNRVVAWSRGPVVLVLAFALALPLGWLTARRNEAYRSELTLWTDTVASLPQSSRAHNNLAWVLQQQGKAVEANAQFARAVALQPDYVTAHYDWGVALLDQGRAAEAIIQLEAAVRLAPGHAAALVNLGNALMQVQRAAEAVACYEQVLRIEPGADVHYDLGVALAELGRRDEAVAHLRTALALAPDLPRAHYQLARLAELAGQPADAEREYLETLRLAPDHALAHAMLGLLLAHSGQLEPAAGHFRAVIRQQPEDADAHANLGNVLLLQGQAREAIAQYEKALRLRPDDPRTEENLELARESLRLTQP